MRELKDVRSSAERWKQLRDLLVSVQTLASSNALLDMICVQRVNDRLVAAIAFEEQLQPVLAKMHEEINLITSELLRVELHVKKRKDHR